MSVKSELKEKVACLKKISIFKDLVENSKAMREIASLFKTVHFSAGENVIEEKIHGHSIYIIKDGSVEVIKKTLHGDSYVVVDLSADMNIFFGEVGLLNPDERSATVRCKTDCEFYKLEREQFLEFGDKNPRIGLVITREISSIVCKRLRKANNDILTLFDALVEEVGLSEGIE